MSNNFTVEISELTEFPESTSRRRGYRVIPGAILSSGSRGSKGPPGDQGPPGNQGPDGN